MKIIPGNQTFHSRGVITNFRVWAIPLEVAINIDAVTSLFAIRLLCFCFYVEYWQESFYNAGDTSATIYHTRE